MFQFFLILYMKVESGIYCIENLINGKKYIGSAVDIKTRWIRHKGDLRRGNHHSLYLQRSFNKYGIELFKFEIIARCPEEYLIKLEQWFINTQKPEYNICKIAGSNRGIKYSEETIKKRINTFNKSKENGWISPAKGRPKPSHIGKKTQELQAKGITQYSKTGEVIREWISARNIEMTLGFIGNEISKCCRKVKNRETAYGFKWKYTNIDNNDSSRNN